MSGRFACRCLSAILTSAVTAFYFVSDFRDPSSSINFTTIFIEAYISIAGITFACQLWIYTFGKFVTTKTSASTSKGSDSKSASDKGVKKETIKIPKGRDLPAASASKFVAKPAREKLPSSAPIEIIIYMYTQAARLLVERFPAVPMYEIIVRHRSRPGMLWQINQALNSCLQRIAAGPNEAELPGTWELFQANWNVRVSFKPQNDPEDFGFTNDVVTFYLAGDQQHLENFLAFLDSCWTDRARFPDAGDIFVLPLNVQIHPHTTVTLSDDLPTRMDNPTVLHAVLSNPCIPFTRGAPAFGNLHILMTLDCENDTNMDITLTGNMYHFRGIMATNNIRGEFYGPLNEQGRQNRYARIFPTVHCNVEEEVATVVRILTEEMHNQLILVRMETPPAESEEETPSETFLTTLKGLPSLVWEIP